MKLMQEGRESKRHVSVDQHAAQRDPTSIKPNMVPFV